MAMYSVEGTKGTTSVRSILALMNTATTTRRARVTMYMVGCITTPADAMFSQQLTRATTDPTGSTITPEHLDEGDTADPGLDGFDGVTVDGTLAASIVNIGVHHRASFTWQPSPGGEIIIAAVDNEGLVGTLRSASTSDFDASMHFDA